ncbi:head-tail adaptor protein [Bacillus alkalicola]|uniref:Head-tail adaptor protein n=2 Tax=Bacillales TaxID=1385 RepID=A0ABS6JYF1_9BACI|nr:head-tail adaptor protein [Bacillus alkalicola]
MSLGKMNIFVDIFNRNQSKDSEGFVTQIDDFVASVRAFREERHGSRKWANLAAFTDANAIFKFRRVPGLEIRSGMLFVCDKSRYTVISVEDINGMYTEVLAEKIEPSKA